MGFVVIGIVLLALKLWAPPWMAQVGWWWVVLPFAAAAAWWTFADHVGITQRRVMAQERERAQKRRERQYEQLGMRAPRPTPPGGNERPPTAPRDRA